MLGSLELVSDGHQVALGGPKQRLVLGLLAAWRGRMVSIDELVDALWPEGPQARPRKTIQVYVARLRGALGASGDAIHTEAAGYRLDPGRLAIDAEAFSRDLEAANASTDDGAAIARYRQALGRWRGDAFADLVDCPAIVPHAVYLDELRVAALQDLFEREIRRGPRAVLGELERTVEENPLHEGFAAQLMMARYRSGHQAEALATYQALRRNLGDELGVEPGPRVRELHGQILRHELDVAAPPTPDEPERQRRRVSILAADLSIAPSRDARTRQAVDPEEELAKVAPVRRAARTLVLQHGGVVLADTGDGLSACFGYPSHESSTSSAVSVGLATRDLVTRTGSDVEARIGIDTGVVVVEAAGDGGAPDQLTGIAGPPLWTSRLLRDHCRPGEVLIGAATAAAVSDSIAMESGPQSDDPVIADSKIAVGLAPRPSTETAEHELIGRDSALDALRAIARQSSNRVCPVVVAGVPGVGKSAVVEAFLAELDPWSVMRVGCDARQSVTPLHPFRAALQELFAATSTDGAEREPSPRDISRALERRWGERQPVLFVDDVHAADPSSVEVLNELVRRLPSGLIVLTSRSEKPFELDGEVVPMILLEPLSRPAVRHLAEAIASPRRLSLQTLNEIADRSDGIPLYAVTLARVVFDTAAGDDVARVPTQLYDSLMAILDRLGPARTTAQRCAVLGGPFTVGELTLVTVADTGTDTDEAKVHLSALVDAGVLVADTEGGYRFAHELVRDAAYGSLLNSERIRLHAQIAETLAQQTVHPEQERLAFHLEAAGRPLDAAVAWRRASTNAIRHARHYEAQQHARRSLTLLDQLRPDAPPEADDATRRALMNLAVGLQATSHGSEELRDVIDRSRQWDVGADDPARLVLLGMIDISNRHALGDFFGAVRVAHDCLAVAERADDPTSIAFARQFLGASLVWRGDLISGTPALEASGEFWAERDLPHVESARALGALWSLLGLAHYLSGRPAIGDRSTEMARDVVPEVDGYTRCLVESTAAIIDQLRDRPAAVLKATEPISSLAMDLSSDFWFGWAQSLLGWATAATQPAAGIALLTEAIDNASTRQAMPYFSYLLAGRLRENDEPHEALRRADAGIAVMTDTGEMLWAPLLHLERARCLEASDMREEAWEERQLAASTANAMGASTVSQWCTEPSSNREDEQ